MRSLLLGLGAVLFASIMAQAQKRPFTFEDMMALKRVEEPVVSPDGKWVLFAAVDVDLKANAKTPHVWAVPLGSQVSENHSGSAEGTEKEIISDQDADRPRWEPDGKRFAFISSKENGSQIWIADFDAATGTVTSKHRLTNLATEADGELWSPDGKNIVFVSNVYPECDGTPAQETACNEQKLKETRESKISAQIFTHLLYRHWNGYKESKRSHLYVVSAAACLPAPPVHSADAPEPGGQISCPYAEARDLTPGDYDAPVFSLGGQDDYAFSPDGQEICYASNHDPEPAISTNNDLFTVPVNFPADAISKDVLAAAKDLTAENKAADNTPLYSPDGNYIAYRAQVRPGYESDRWRLMLYNRKTGEKRNLSESFDRWVGTFVWARDSVALYFNAEDKGVAPVHRINMSTGKIETFTQGSDDDLSITNDGKFLLFTRMSIAHPSQIYVLDLENRDHSRQLVDLNSSLLSHIQMSPLESFWFTGANNDKVEGFLVKPPNFDPNKKYPVKFLIHGGPQGAWGDDWSYRWNPELFAADGYVAVMINFRGSTGYGQKFTDAIRGDWGGAPFEDLMKGLDYAEQHYRFIDKDRECALGASYRGYMANWILGHTNRFKCIVSHDGMFNSQSAWGTTEELWFNEWEFKGTPYNNRELYRKWSPHLSATNFKTPTLLIHGQKDYRLDVSEGFQLFTTLQRLGVPSKMLYFPDEGHWVLKPQNSQLWYKMVNDWVDQWLEKQSREAK